MAYRASQRVKNLLEYGTSNPMSIGGCDAIRARACTCNTQWCEECHEFTGKCPIPCIFRFLEITFLLCLLIMI